MIEFVPAAHYFWITTVLSHACRHPHAFFFSLPAPHVTLAWLVLPQRHKSELQRTTGSHQFAFSPSVARLLSTLTRLIRTHKELGVSLEFVGVLGSLCYPCFDEAVVEVIGAFFVTFTELFAHYLHLGINGSLHLHAHFFFHLRKPAGRSLVFSPVSIANLLGDHCLCHQSLLLHTCIQNHHVVCRDTSNVSLLMHNSIRKTLYYCATGEHDISFSTAAILQKKKREAHLSGPTALSYRELKLHTHAHTNTHNCV